MKEAGSPAWGTYHDWIRVATRERLQFVDLTQCIIEHLRTSETLNVVDGTLQLGRWQRIFLAEMDRGRNRTVSVMILGE